MQGAHAGMGVPRAFGAVTMKHFGQACGVLGQVFERHRAVFDKRHRLAVALHAHHDVQPGLAHFPKRFLLRGTGHAHDRAGQAQIAHQFVELRKFGQLHGRVRAGKFDQQDRLRRADQRCLDHRAKCRIGNRQRDHRVIDQFDRGRAELDDMLGEIHRLMEAREIHHAQHFVSRQRCKLQRDLPAEGEGAFGAHQQMRKIGHAIRAVGLGILAIEHVDVVARDAPQDLGHLLDNLCGFALCDLLQACDQRLQARVGRHGIECRETGLITVGEHRVDADHVVHHVAVFDRARTAGIVAGHAAYRALGRGRHIDRKPQAMRLEPCVQMVEHEPRFNGHGARLRIERQHLMQPFTRVDNERLAHRLPALAGAGSASENGYGVMAGDIERDDQVVLVARHDHPDRRDLVDRRVRCIAAARGAIEHHIAAQLAAQVLRQRRCRRAPCVDEAHRFDQSVGRWIQHERLLIDR